MNQTNYSKIQLFDNILAKNKDLLVSYMIDNELLRNKNHCPGEMVRIKKERYIDGIFWRCNSCKKEMGLRNGSFFYGLKIELEIIIKIVVYWCEEKLVKNAAIDLNVSEKTIMKVYSEIRKLCQNELENNEMKVDGNKVIGKLFLNYPNFINKFFKKIRVVQK